MNRVSKRRAAENKQYLALRADFLREHPYCQVWLQENGFSEAEAIENNGHVGVSISEPMIRVPRATDIHHKAGRTGGNFLGADTWMAVCRQNHKRVHDNPKWAQAQGYLIR